MEILVMSSIGFCTFKLYIVGLHYLIKPGKWLLLLLIFIQYEKWNGQFWQQVTTLLEYLFIKILNVLVINVS